jgi:hypothetical protein
MESKIMVVAKEGQALVGTATHELNGICETTFETNNIPSLVEFIKGVENAQVYFDESKIEIHESEPQYDSEPIAVCVIENDAFLKKLIEANGKKFTLDSMEVFLTTFRDFFDKDGKQMLDFCVNGSVNKITKVVKSKDNSGNLNLNVTRESGKDDFKCPQKISFTIPVIKHIDKKVKFEFDMFMNFREGSEAPIVELWFLNLNLATVIEDFKKTIVLNEISSVALLKFWGSLKLQKKTDSWKYKEHGI